MANERAEWAENYKYAYFKGTTPVKKLERLFRFEGYYPAENQYQFRQLNVRTGTFRMVKLNEEETAALAPVIPITSFIWTGAQGGLVITNPTRQFHKAATENNIEYKKFNHLVTSPEYIELSRQLGHSSACAAIACEYLGEDLPTFNECVHIINTTKEGVAPFSRLFALEKVPSYTYPLILYKDAALGVYDMEDNSLHIRERWKHFAETLFRKTGRGIVIE